VLKKTGHPDIYPVPNPKSRTEVHRTLEFGRKEAQDMGDQ